MDIDNPIKTTVEEIRKVLNIENIIGNPIETDDKILIPVTMMGMGFGAGMGGTWKDYDAADQELEPELELEELLELNLLQ